MCGATSCGACGWNASYEASYTGNKRDGVVCDGADHLIDDGGQRTYGVTGQQVSASYGWNGYWL